MVQESLSSHLLAWRRWRGGGLDRITAVGTLISGTFSEEILRYLLITCLLPCTDFPLGSSLSIDACRQSPVPIHCVRCGSLNALSVAPCGRGMLASVTLLLPSCFTSKGVATVGTVEVGDLCWCQTAAEHPMLFLVLTAAVKTEQELSTTPDLTNWEFSLNTSYLKTAELAVAFTQGRPHVLWSREIGAVWGWSRPHAAS